MTYEHNKHDRLLVSRYAGDDSYPAERADAEKLISSCSQCAELASDIRVLVQRSQGLPAPARPRDFRITAEEAERMRGSRLERVMRRIAAPGWGTALRPVAGAAMALGLTVAAVGSLPSMGVGAPSMEADPGSQQQLEQMSAVPGAGAQAPMEGEPAIPSGRQAADGSGQEFAAASPMTIAVDEVYVNEPAGDGSEIERAAIAEAGPNPLVVGGLLVAALALGLLIVSWIARRRFADPLLR